MKLIALDSSGMVASVAVLEDDTLIAEYTINYKKTHSQTLLPMLEEVKNMTELNLSTVDAIALAAGPGSFTGLRIGSATAKGLGFALNIPLIPIPTVDARAYNLYGTDKLVCPILDARRNQVYTGIYSFERDEDGYAMKVLQEQCAVSIDEILEQLGKLGKEVIFLGDGVSVFKEMIKEKCKVSFSFAPAHMNRQKASSVAALGKVYFSEGRTVTAMEHEPE